MALRGHPVEQRLHRWADQRVFPPSDDGRPERVADQAAVDEVLAVVHLQDRAAEERAHPLAVDARAETLLVAEDDRSMLVRVNHDDIGAEVVHALYRGCGARDDVLAVGVAILADVRREEVGDVEVVLGRGHGSGHLTRWVTRASGRPTTRSRRASTLDAREAYRYTGGMAGAGRGTVFVGRERELAQALE